MKKNSLRQMVVISLLMAIMIVMSIVPYLGYIPLGAISVTIVHIPVLIGSLLYGIKAGAFLGLAFGVTSFLNAALRPLSLMDGFFVNPLVSILPRLLFGIVAALLVSLFKKFKYEKVSIFVSLVLATLIHTLLVMTSLYFVFFKDVMTLYPNISLFGFLAMFITTGLLEGVVGAIISLTVSSAIKKIS